MGDVYIDGMLPSGLRSAPKIFSAVADALEWCITQKGVDYIFHYLDDFFSHGPTRIKHLSRKLRNIGKAMLLSRRPISPQKREGPSPVLIFLGIIIDTLQGELRLPADKLQ